MMEATGHYKKWNSMHHHLIELDYFMKIETFKLYMKRCKVAPYSVIRQISHGEQNIALGIARNIADTAVRIHARKRFPEGIYVNLSRGSIPIIMNNITSFLEYGLMLRGEQKLCRRELVKNIKHQHFSVLNELEKIQEYLNNPIMKITGICTREVFEEQLKLIWVD